MAVTYCVLPFAQRIAALPKSKWKHEIEKVPETCERDCTPGGCRKWCREYALGEWVRRRGAERAGVQGDVQ